MLLIIVKLDKTSPTIIIETIFNFHNPYKRYMITA